MGTGNRPPMIHQTLGFARAKAAIRQIVAPDHRVFAKVLKKARQADIARVAPADHDAGPGKQNGDLAKKENIVRHLVDDPHCIHARPCEAAAGRRGFTAHGGPIPRRLRDCLPGDRVRSECR